VNRELLWPGCINARDLGGIPILGGGSTRWRSVVRSDNPAYLDEEGWAALHAYGIRTIVALRTGGTKDDEPDASRVPRDVEIARVFLEDLGDADFKRRFVDTGLWCSPHYYGDAIARWPDRCAAAISAVARAGPGGVVVACGRGCDRTGLVALLLLALAGVGADDIAADWEMSVERLRPRQPEYPRELDEMLRRENTTVRACIARTLTAVDIEGALRRGGLGDDDLSAARARLREAA
jgi:hypothetical protein